MEVRNLPVMYQRASLRCVSALPVVGDGAALTYVCVLCVPEQVQTERAYQKQAGVQVGFHARKGVKKVGKAGQRYYKNVGLGFKTPHEAVYGESCNCNCWGARHTRQLAWRRGWQRVGLSGRPQPACFAGLINPRAH